MKNPSHERSGSLITPLPRASLLSTKSLSTAISPPSHSIRTPRKGTTSSDQPPPPAIFPNVERAHHSKRPDRAARHPHSQPKERVAGTTQPRELSSPAPARCDWCAAGERWAEIANLAVFLAPADHLPSHSLAALLLRTSPRSGCPSASVVSVLHGYR